MAAPEDRLAAIESTFRGWGDVNKTIADLRSTTEVEISGIKQMEVELKINSIYTALLQNTVKASA